MNYDKIYIDGQWIKPNSEKWIEVINPATEEVIERVVRSNEKDTNLAIKAAKEAFDSWQYTDVSERIAYMEKVRDLLIENMDDLAKIIVAELGCGLKFAKNGHLKGYIYEIDHFISLASDYEFIEDYDGYKVYREPVGVVACITPWNYPFGQISKKVVPAILAGNTVVLKPSQQTPLIAYALTEIIDQAGLPAGVFNFVPGVGGEVGDILASSEDVDRVSFTGSTKGGIEVGKLAIGDVKKIALELGGKSAAIVVEDANLDIAAKVTLDTVYNNTGQTCSALTRLLVPENMKKEVEEKIIELTKEYKFGDPKDEETIIGPLISQKQFDKVSYYIDKGLEEGAKLLIGERPKKEGKGYYVGPTVFTDVNNSMTIAQEEIFGPVLSIISYKNVDEAIEIANDIEYGLSGAVFGPEEACQYVARRMKTGMVIVNDKKRTFRAPFGGYKHSGLGREGGNYGFDEFLEVKTVYL